MGFCDGSGISWTSCASLQTDNHTNTSSLNFYRPDALSDPNQQCQSTEVVAIKTFHMSYDQVVCLGPIASRKRHIKRKKNYIFVRVWVVAAAYLPLSADRPINQLHLFLSTVLGLETCCTELSVGWVGSSFFSVFGRFGQL